MAVVIQLIVRETAEALPFLCVQHALKDASSQLEDSIMYHAVPDSKHYNHAD